MALKIYIRLKSLAVTGTGAGIRSLTQNLNSRYAFVRSFSSFRNRALVTSR